MYQRAVSDNPGVTELVVEQRFAGLPQRLVAVHARAVVAEQWLRHERCRLARGPRGVLDDVLVEHQLVGCVQQAVEAIVDLRLSGCADLVVSSLYLDADRAEVRHHVVAQVGVVVDRRHREVTALVARLVAAVAALLDAAGVPLALDRVDEVVAGILLGLEADVVEDVELRFGTEVDRVRDAGRRRGGPRPWPRCCADRGCTARRSAGRGSSKLSASVLRTRNGSTKAVVGSGFSFMSDSWISWKPRIDEPSNIRPVRTRPRRTRSPAS